MAPRGKAAAPPAADGPPAYASPSSWFRTPRQIVWFTLYLLYLCVDIAELGLVSQQIHRYGGQTTNWPAAEVGHVMGLLLFATIFALLVGLFHWALSLRIFLVTFLATGVFFGTGAGVIYGTPFGGSVTQCRQPTDSFPANYQPYVIDCSRWKAIEGLAWVMFALSVVGFFYALVDQYEFRVSRSAVYDVDVESQKRNKEAADSTEA